MAELLEDDLGRPKPQYEKPDGSGFEAWKGKDGHGNVRSDDGQIVALGSTTDTSEANTVIGKLVKLLESLPSVMPAEGIPFLPPDLRVALVMPVFGGSVPTICPVEVVYSQLPEGAATEAKQDMIAGHVDDVETLLTAIKDTDGIKKITDTVSTDMTSRFDTIKAAPVVGVKTVTTSAAEVFAGASRLASRYLMAVTNESSQIIYWGPSGVTVANGFCLYPGDTHIFRFSPAVATPVYMIAAASAQIRVGEMA